MQPIKLTDIWTSAGVILGFQMTLLFWRLRREVDVGDEGWITWFTPSDYLGIASSLFLVFGVFLLPNSGIGGVRLAAATMGIGVVLFVGHFLGLCGHYEVFDRSRVRSGGYFPRQEKTVLALALMAAIVYSAIQLTLAVR